MKGLDSRSALLTALTIAVILLTIVLSLTFAQAQQTQRVAEAANDRQQAVDAAASARFARSQVESALLFTAAVEAGVADRAQRDAAVDGLRDTVEFFTASTNPSLALSKEIVIEEIEELIVLLESGDTTAARIHIDGRLAPQLETIQRASTTDRMAADEIIAVESSTAGRWAWIASFGVAVIVPAVALIAFRALATRRRQQQELEQRLEREFELNAAKDEMISNLSHELRTPLTGIYGFALAMEESGFNDRAMQTEMTSLIIHEAADLSRMVDDLLTAAKAEGDGLHFQNEPVDVAREVSEAVTPFLRGEAHIDLDIEPGIVVADRLRLRQVLRNLISNATNHGGPGIGLRGRRSGDRYEFEVLDDGDGVPEQVVERLFERFVHRGETPLLTGSVGLGLSIVKVLVDGMGGTVHYQHEGGQTCFRVSLPAGVGEGTDLSDVLADIPRPPDGPVWGRGPAGANGSARSLPSPPPPVSTTH